LFLSSVAQVLVAQRTMDMESLLLFDPELNGGE
jgi:hypothetical protein